MPMKSIVVALCLLVLSATPCAFAQDDLDGAIVAYEEALDEFTRLYEDTSNYGPLEPAGDRIYRQTVEAGRTLVERIYVLIEDYDLSEEERVGLLDLALGTRQIVGSLLADVRLCEEALVHLDELIADPETAARPVVLEAATRSRTNAELCVQEQRREADLLAREREIRELEERIAETEDADRLAELQAQLASLRGQDLPATYTVPADDRGRLNVPAVVVLSVGAATLAGALGWDLALSSDRRTVDDYRDTLDPADFEAAQRAADNIDGAKLPLGIMYGVGGAAALTGVIWLAINPRFDDDGDASASAFAPMFLRDGMGVSFTRTF